MDWDLKLGRVMDEGGERTVTRRRRTATTGVGGGGPAPAPAPVVACLVDGCTWDLSTCREYHRRHRVCERHSKTPVVLVAGQEQRFCQQCSRFHSLGEFDEVKRSCRKRLDGHNRRRRKTQPESTYIRSASTSPAATTSPLPPPTTTLFPPPPLFHIHPIRHPLPPSMYPPQSAIPSWPMAPLSFPQPTVPSHPFGFGSRHHGNERADVHRRRGDVGHIDCALSLLSSGTTRRPGSVGQQQHLDWQQQQQQQQGFDGSGSCSASASHVGGSGSGSGGCYGFDDDNDGSEPSRMFPFSWD